VKLLLENSIIQKKVSELGKEISEVYRDEELTVVVVLKGSFIFAADLVRAIDNINLNIEFVQLSSYVGTKSSGSVDLVHGDLKKFENKNLLIVEDIVDTGLTLSSFLKEITKAGVKSYRVCSFLEKSEINAGKVKIDFLGFDIPDKFVVGYGLDCDQKFRNIPDVLIYKED